MIQIKLLLLWITIFLCITVIIFATFVLLSKNTYENFDIVAITGSRRSDIYFDSSKIRTLDQYERAIDDIAFITDDKYNQIIFKRCYQFPNRSYGIPNLDPNTINHKFVEIGSRNERNDINISTVEDFINYFDNIAAGENNNFQNLVRTYKLFTNNIETAINTYVLNDIKEVADILKVPVPGSVNVMMVQIPYRKAEDDNIIAVTSPDRFYNTPYMKSDYKDPSRKTAGSEINIISGNPVYIYIVVFYGKVKRQPLGIMDEDYITKSYSNGIEVNTMNIFDYFDKYYYSRGELEKDNNVNIQSTPCQVRCPGSLNYLCGCASTLNNYNSKNLNNNINAYKTGSINIMFRKDETKNIFSYLPQDMITNMYQARCLGSGYPHGMQNNVPETTITDREQNVPSLFVNLYYVNKDYIKINLGDNILV